MMNIEHSVITEAEAQLAKFADDDCVMVHLTSKKTGRTQTLFAKGGIDVSKLRSDLRGEIERQAERLAHGAQFNWDDVADIEFEEY